MTTIERLWAEDYQLPAEDGLYFADGRSYDVAITPGTPAGLTVLEPFDLDAMLAEDPSWVSSVDGRAVADLGDRGLLWAGEGPMGADGFIARLTADRKLIWALFFSDSNPFDRIRVSGNVAAFHSTAEFELAVDIDDPRTQAPPAVAERGPGGSAPGGVSP
ncbi:hypothetical protein P8A18_11495 [Streptomyces castrisilvae]|uniref:Uncharacterized protein n=1 Tax=Streptomyces castrisilvae TaxID=3033811 RepID=A0ABY9HHK9_9ACTN|nr:hypothetical protein [Streptomyces sp. Mut1]WLQ34027.1 hypothetical protein P8A18_11495 [Streptomyces sp. Mut1]